MFVIVQKPTLKKILVSCIIEFIQNQKNRTDVKYVQICLHELKILTVTTWLKQEKSLTHVKCALKDSEYLRF